MYIWYPLDFTALPTEQKDSMFVAWCKSVIKELAALGAKGSMLLFEEKGEVGPATEKVIQGAQVWITKGTEQFLYNLLVPFNDMLANEPIRHDSTTLRNDPAWYAKDLINRAEDKKLFPPPPDTYGLLPRPENPDLVA